MSNFSSTLESKWNQVKGRLKKTYASLTDDDLTYLEGQEEEWLGKLQEKTGKTKNELKSFINSI